MPKTFHHILAGGTRRSIGRANEAAELVLRYPARFRELILCLWSDDPVVRMRAADAAEKASAQRPDLLAPHKAELLGLAGEATQAELRWHLAALLPRLPLTQPERRRALACLIGYLDDRSSIVKTLALQGLADLARGHEEMQATVTSLLEACSRSGTPAMRARSRHLLADRQPRVRRNI